MPTQRTHKITMGCPHGMLYKICMMGGLVDGGPEGWDIDSLKHFRACLIDMFNSLSGYDPDFMEQFTEKILPRLWSPPDHSLQKLHRLLKEINVELELK